MTTGSRVLVTGLVILTLATAASARDRATSAAPKA